MNLVEGKIVVVTGAAKGIGEAVVKVFAQNKAKGVIIADIDIKNAEEVAKLVSKNFDCKCLAIKTDVTCEKEVRNVFDVAMEEFGTVDILVNSAGICRIVDINDITMKQWDMTMEINLKGTFLFCREALKIMKSNKNGKIVNVASQAGKIGGLIVGPDYPASKAGVICLTKSIAKNGASYGINVNSVAPGLIATEMTNSFGYDPNMVPLNRIGTAEEVADVILFLASNLSRYITGSSIDINGGITMN